LPVGYIHRLLLLNAVVILMSMTYTVHPCHIQKASVVGSESYIAQNSVQLRLLVAGIRANNVSAHVHTSSRKVSRISDIANSSAIPCKRTSFWYNATGHRGLAVCRKIDYERLDCIRKIQSNVAQTHHEHHHRNKYRVRATASKEFMLAQSR